MNIGTNTDKWQSSLVKSIAIGLLAGVVGLFASSAAYATHKPGHGGGPGGGGNTIGDLGCTEGMIAKFVGGAWTCAEDVDTDTQLDAAGIEALVGPHTVDTNTNAVTLCGTELFLDGDGNCVDLFALIDDLQAQIDALQPPKTVFTTSASFNGNLGGLAGADSLCQVAADSGIVPPGVYVAWLSTTSEDARDRALSGSDHAYTLPDGTTIIATSEVDLLDGVLLNPIDQYEHCLFISSFVWTGSTAQGTLSPGGESFDRFTCGDWSMPISRSGAQASSGSLDALTFKRQRSCEDLAFSAHLYCFEQ